MSPFPILEGLAASGLAIAIVAGWLAIGLLLIPPTADSRVEALPVAMLGGSGITSFMMAVGAKAGEVPEALVVLTVLSAAAAFLARRRVKEVILSNVGRMIAVLRNRAIAVSAMALGALMWASAIAEPRSADAMRYHLAHIRQILSDGAWQPIPDYTYAFPFGWSLQFMPFEALGLPQGSQLLGLMLFVAIVASALSVSRAATEERLKVIALLPLLHPFVIKTFIEPGADPYGMFVVAVVALLLMQLRVGDEFTAIALGFASWIGIQSRYQLVAVGIVATVIAGIVVWSRVDRRRMFTGIATGSAAAMILASPFYIANLVDYGNPVWPLFIGADASSYQDEIGRFYTSVLSKELSLPVLRHSLAHLFTFAPLFPLPAVITVAAIVLAVGRDRRARLAGSLTLGFLGLWLLMQPRLYPRFILLVLPAIVLGAMAALERRTLARSLRPAVPWLLALAVVVTGLTSYDNLRFVATGDALTYHRFTWFYPVYQWVNRNTARGDRFLVIVSSGQSYYLDRPYRRADPMLSGVVDWARTDEGGELVRILDRGCYSHVIYEARNWNTSVGGRQMERAVTQAIGSGELTTVQTFEARLYTSRFRRAFRDSRVLVLRRTPAGDTASRLDLSRPANNRCYSIPSPS